MINHVCVEYLKTILLFIKTVVCILLFIATTTVNAQSSEPLSEKMAEQKAEPVIDTEEKKIETVSEESAEEIEEYNIYKKQNPVDPCDRGLDTYDYETSWYDHSQIYINSRFCEPALWFDNFFANDRLFEEGVAGTYARWRNEFTFDEEEPFKFKMRLNFSVELPGFEDKLRLTFSSEEDEGLRDVTPGGGEDTTPNTLGLQLDIKENARSKFNVSVSFSPRIRFRYRYTYPVFKDLILRFTQEVQRKKQTNSARTLFNVEQAFKQRFLFQSSTEGKVSEEFDGVDWLQAFILYQRINKKASISYEISANGITEPRSLTTNYRAGVRFRRNFHRNWLFYEIAPEVTWPITLDEERQLVLKDRRSKWLLFFRIEVHFGNAYKKRYKDYN